jgi:hypothetical protein
MMKTPRKDRERGQVLLLVALSIVVLVAFVALAVDIGQAYRERRAMQNAADAGALAGAYEFCYGTGTDPEQDAIDAAEDYAIARNGADGALIQVNTPLTVTVVASKSVSTFFAGLIGFDTIAVDADATAACGKAEAAGLVWPISFQNTFPDNPVCGSTVVLWEDGEGANCCEYNCRDAWERPNRKGNVIQLNVDIKTDGDCPYDPSTYGYSELGLHKFWSPLYAVAQGRTWLDFSTGLLVDIEDPCDQTGCGASELSDRIEGKNNQGEACLSYLDLSADVDGVCIPGDTGDRISSWTAAGTQAGNIALIPLYDPDRSYDRNADDPTANQCTIAHDPGDHCSHARFFVTDLGCVRVIGPYYFFTWDGGKKTRVILAEIPCVNGASDPECNTHFGYTTGEAPQPGDPKVVNLVLED